MYFKLFKTWVFTLLISYLQINFVITRCSNTAQMLYAAVDDTGMLALCFK